MSNDSKYGKGKRIEVVPVNRNGRINPERRLVGQTVHEIPKILDVVNGTVRWQGATTYLDDFVKSHRDNIDYLVEKNADNPQARRLIHFLGSGHYKYNGEDTLLNKQDIPKNIIVERIKLKEDFVNDLRKQKDKDDITRNDIIRKQTKLNATYHKFDHQTNQVKFYGLNEDSDEICLATYTIDKIGKLDLLQDNDHEGEELKKSEEIVIKTFLRLDIIKG